MVQAKNIGETLRLVLLRAMIERRVIVGLTDAISVLSTAADHSLFCILADSDDKVQHMQRTLIEAFCYEHSIYMLRVDKAEKLSRIVGADSARKASCTLIQKPFSTNAKKQHHDDDDVDDLDELLTPTERDLVDYCEQYWDFPSECLELPV